MRAGEKSNPEDNYEIDPGVIVKPNFGFLQVAPVVNQPFFRVCRRKVFVVCLSREDRLLRNN